MMQINKPLLQKMAQLAQLDIGAHNEAALRRDLSEIVTWIEKLQELDTAGVDPLETMSLEPIALQEDIPQAPLAHERGLANAPVKIPTISEYPKSKHNAHYEQPWQHKAQRERSI